MIAVQYKPVPHHPDCTNVVSTLLNSTVFGYLWGSNCDWGHRYFGEIWVKSRIQLCSVGIPEGSTDISLASPVGTNLFCQSYIPDLSF